ncbi:CLUMA_CG010307, isoform A, partial [Clunio marinus]
MAMEVSCLTEVESFRSYLDNLFSENDIECYEATNKIKNLIIGSNKQKRFIIEQGFVPRLIALVQNESKPLNLRLNVAIIIGSLSKGTESNVQDLDKFGTSTLLLNLALCPNTNPKMIEICLSVIKTSMQYPSKIRNSFFQHFEDINTLSRLIKLASPDTSINCQQFVVSILLSFCGLSQGNVLSASMNLCQAGGIPFLAPLKSNDSQIVYKTLPCLARLCAPEFDESIRAEAAESLAYLAEIDSELQKLAAISNHLISNLTNLLHCSNQSSKEAALKCFASLAANDETIRKRIIDMRGLIDIVLDALKEVGSVRVAGVRCLHSLSRSVQLLRTTFQDHKIWKPLMNLIHDKPSPELMTVVSSTICNLLLEFSPAKESLLDSGAISILCELTKSPNAALRLNGAWALMNMAFQAEQHVKTEIINALGTDRIFQLLSDSDTRVIMKTLGLLRNLLSSTVHIESIMASHASEILNAVMMVLDSPQHSSEIKEQALCIVGNLAAGAHELIMADEKILLKLKDYLIVDDHKLQTGALFAIKNLMHKSSQHDKLKEVGIIMKLNELLESNSTDIQFDE